MPHAQEAVDQAKDILTFSFNYLVTGGYLAVALVFLALAYFTKDKVAKYTFGWSGFALLLAYASFNILAVYFPDLLFERSNINGVIFKAFQGEPIQLFVEESVLQPRGPYIRRENDPNETTLTNHWFISPWDHNYDCMTLQVGQVSAGQLAIFSIPITPQDATGNAVLEIFLSGHDAATRQARMIRFVNKQRTGEVTLARFTDREKTCNSTSAKLPQKGGFLQKLKTRNWGSLIGLVGSAAAQAGSTDTPQQSESKNRSYDDFVILLQSDDPYTRRHAREQLGQMGDAAIPIIRQLIGRPEYQLQLGSLAALENLSPTALVKLPDEIRAKVQEMTLAPDETMRKAANSVLNTYRSARVQNAAPVTDMHADLLITVRCMKKCDPTMNTPKINGVARVRWDSIIEHVGISQSPIDQEPPSQPTLYSSLLDAPTVEGKGATRMLRLALLTTPARVRLTVPDADQNAQPNIQIGHLDASANQLSFPISAGASRRVTVFVRGEIWNGFFRAAGGKPDVFDIIRMQPNSE